MFVKLSGCREAYHTILIMNIRCFIFRYICNFIIAMRLKSGIFSFKTIFKLRFVNYSQHFFCQLVRIRANLKWPSSHYRAYENVLISIFAINNAIYNICITSFRCSGNILCRYNKFAAQ